MTLVIALNIIVLVTEVIYNTTGADSVSFERQPQELSRFISWLRAFNVDKTDLALYIKSKSISVYPHETLMGPFYFVLALHSFSKDH